MSVITDGLRSDRWVPFAKKQLNTIKSLELPAKALEVQGYQIRLLALDDIEKIHIKAPPVAVVTHIEYPPSGFGAEKLYYSEPYGSSAGLVGPTGNSVDGVYQIVRTVTGAYYDAPGSGVIFPTPTDFYHKSSAFWADFGGTVGSIATLDTKFAEAAAKDLSAPAELLGAGSTATSVGGWQVSVGSNVFAAYFNMHGEGSNTMQVLAYGLNRRANLFFDLDSAEVQATLGITYPPGKHLNIRGAYVYPAPTVGLARLAVFASPTDYLDALGGVYFFDFTFNPPDATHTIWWLSWTFIGRCLTGGLTGSAWVNDTALPKCGGPVVANGTQTHKSSVFADGAGGVKSLIRKPGDTTGADGAYSFTPSLATRLAGHAFPTPISDAQTWPTIFRGVDTDLCIMEKIYDTGAGTNPLVEIVGIYTGSPAAWSAVPLPAGTLLAVRPVHVGASRVVLVGVVWASPATSLVQYDSALGAVWTIMGSVSPSRMTRPIVGFFGAHGYSKLASDFTGSFPVTSWAGTHAYTGA